MERAPGLPFAKFVERYGASCRTKNVVVVPPTPIGRIGLVSRFMLGRVDPGRGRAYPLPATSPLPHDFIRLDPWEAEYLYLCAQEARLGIVEVGRFQGGSTFLLACANQQVPIWSIDVDPQDDEHLRRSLAENGVGENVSLLVADSRRVELPEGGRYDLLFVDGDHSYAGCLGDLERLVPGLAAHGHIVVHDCYAESEVQQAVLDFMRRTDLETVRSPHIPRRHWLSPYGSIAHLTKPAAARALVGESGPPLVGAKEVSILGSMLRRARGTVEAPHEPKDPRRGAEVRGERVVFQTLEREGFLERFRGCRILEIGPKHGHDSLLLAGLGPSELVLIDLPEKDELVQSWLFQVEERCPTRYVEANLLYMTPAQLRELGRFDLVWCTGVVYHNAEQLRLLRRLFRLCADEGALVLESSTTRDPELADRNVVEIHWPSPYRGTEHVTHLPSRLALKSWLEMVGFGDVEIEDVYSKGIAWQRAVLTASRPVIASPHTLFESEDGPVWVAGDSTGHVDHPDAPLPPPAPNRPKAPSRQQPIRRPAERGGGTRRRLRTARQQTIAMLVGGMTVLFMLLVFLPEELGDRPYDVFGLKF